MNNRWEREFIFEKKKKEQRDKESERKFIYERKKKEYEWKKERKPEIKIKKKRWRKRENLYIGERENESERI